MIYSTLLMISALIIMPAVPPPEPINECRANADCVIVEGPCANSWIPTNKLHEEEVKKRVATMKPQIECFTPQFKGTPPGAICKDNFCVIGAEKTPQ